MIVYYDTWDYNDKMLITVTEKDFWDANHDIDDGSGPHYDDINAAMKAASAVNLASSIYSVTAGGADAVVSAMRTAGFEMQANTEFSAFVHER